MAADHHSRKENISKDFILRFFTFFFKSCFGCFRQPPPEKNTKGRNLVVVNKHDGRRSPVMNYYRNTAAVPISHTTASYGVGSSKQQVNEDKERRVIQSEMQIPRSKRKSPVGGGGGSGGDLTVGGGDEIKSIVGALIVSVTLIVMLVWGKLCAIICAALWLYFVPRVRANNNYLEMKDRENYIDIDSWEYKKKVVFEGFLERNKNVRI